MSARKTARKTAAALVLLLLCKLTGCASDPVGPSVDIQTLGALGDGKTKATAALQRALDQCAAAGGGEVVVPAGNYPIGSVQIGSNTTLKISEGATLIGSPDPADYPLIPVRFEGETVQGHRALIYADHASHIAIIGPGTLQGDALIGDLRRPRAPVMMELVHCDNIRLEDFKDRYRRMWSIHLLYCHDVLARNLNIRTTRTNGDGIDVDSTTDVVIDKCDIDTGDDAISLKSGRGLEAVQSKLATANVVISDCTLGSNFAGVGIGTEMSGGVHDVRIERCKFTHGDNAIFLKSRLGRGGILENISATDMDTTTKTCIGINLVSKGIVGKDPVTGPDAVPLMRHVSFNNITIHSGILIDGSHVLADKPIDDFSMTNVTGTCKRAISLANAVHVNLQNIHVTGFTGPFLETENVTGTGLDAAVAPAVSEMAQLADSFLQPPDDARPMVRWWWFGPAVTKPELAREIDAMKAGGFGGFEVQPTYPLAIDDKPTGITNFKFQSPEFYDDLKFVSDKAVETGMRMDLTLGSGWPYGGPQFPITEAAGRLRVQNARGSGGQAGVPALKDGETLIAAFSGNTELTVKDGAAQLPAGSASEVAFFIAGHTGMKVKRPAIGAEGYVIDHDSPAVVAKFIDTMGKKEIEACGVNAPYSIFCDSLEVGGEDWTDNFLAEFQKRRGYDLRPLLPALTTDIGPKTLDIRHDWGQTLTELFNDSFVKPMHNLAADHKTKFRIQAYGSPSAGLFSYADTDLPEGEGYQWHDYRATRYASSASHLMGKPVTSSETFTWLHSPVFRATPLDIKAEADLHFIQGVNQIICHGWPYTPPGVADPGWSFYAAAVFDDKNPWYIAMPDVTKYLTRMCGLMREGKPANDVALYLANDDAWANFTPGKISLTDGVGRQMGNRIVGDILDAGYNLDFFDDQMLDKFGKIDGGGMVFGDLRYKVVVLAGVESMPVATLRKLEAMARAGGVVIATRSKPSIAPGYLATAADTQETLDISKRLFDGPDALGIFIKNDADFASAMASRLAPDVKFDPPAPQIGVVHRHTSSAEIYFLANTSNKPVAVKGTFRVEGQNPQQWNPVTGGTKSIDITDRPAGGSSVSVTLDAYESTVIVWTEQKLPAAKPASELATVPPIDLSSDWTVQFGAAAQPLPMQTLHSWTSDAATRGFSGVCTYTKRVNIPAELIGREIELNFGPSSTAPASNGNRAGKGFQADLLPPVRDVAVVYINDHRAGSVWCSPYGLDLSKWLTAGDNQIRIEVANTAVNAIAGHGFPNYDNRALTQQFGERFSPASPNEFQQLPSGLLGPIQLLIENQPGN